MKGTKKIVVLSVLMSGILATSVSLAGAEGKARMDPQERIERMATHLELSDEQITQLSDLMDQRREEFAQRKQDFQASGERPSRDEMRSLREAARAEHEAALKAILSEEQWEKYQNRPKFEGDKQHY